ncbi:CHAT domain-containing protein [Micromonospora sp. NPDC049645]|uniref:CHAT domain-containing protein n=1 Tax=Micromonospora sp. NPDC049645 TaxID=3155508 RepID=UPI0034257E69
MLPFSALTEYGRGLLTRYERHGDPDDLLRAEKVMRLVVQTCPPDAAELGGYRSNLAVVLRLRYQTGGGAALIDEAITELEKGYAALPATDPDRGALLVNQAMLVRLRYENNGERADLHTAVRLAREGVTATAAGHPQWPAIAGTLVGLLRLLAEHTATTGPVDEGIDLARRVLDRAPRQRPTLAAAAALHRLRFDHSQDRADLDRCVVLARAAIDGMQQTMPGYGRLAAALGAALFARYERYGDPADIDAAIEATSGAIDATPAGDVTRAEFAANLAGALRARFDTTGDRADLDAALLAGTQAVTAAPATGPVRVAALVNMASTHQARYEHDGQLSDLTAAIDLRQQALAARPHDRQLPALHSSLATAWRARYERSGDLADLDAATRAGQAAVDTVGPHAAARGRYLANLSAAHRTRFERTGDRTDLDHAERTARQSVAVTGDDDPARPRRLSTLGLALLRRYGQDGDRGAIDEAITVGRDAVAGTPAEHRLRPRLLGNLANALRARYERSGDLSDLNEAIAAARQAVDTSPTGDALRPRRLANLGAALLRRFESSADLNDIDQAVEAGAAAVTATPDDHRDRPMYLSNLALSRFRRYERRGDPADLAAAITDGQAAVAATPDDHPHRGGYLSNLVSPLLAAAARAGDDDPLLDLAVEIAATAVAHPAATAHDLGGFQFNLGIALQTRHRGRGTETDRLSALAAFASCAAATGAAPLVRATAAINEARLYADAEQWADADRAYATALDLLPLISDWRTGWDSRLRQLARLGELGSDAAAVALRQGDQVRALVVLEQARGVLLGQALDIRGDLGMLRADRPDLAERLDRLRAVLNADTGASSETDADLGFMTDPTAGRRAAVAQFEELLRTIRAIPEHARFLTAPDADDLLRAAIDAPIAVVNSSPYGSAALLVRPHGVAVIPLPALRHGDVTARVNEFLTATAAPDWTTSALLHRLLDWLWRTIAAPVLDALTAEPAAAAGPLPRLYWLVTGQLGLLPLHAAGNAEQSLLDSMVSSYTPTIRVLTHTAPAPTGSVGPALVVGVTDNGSGRPLVRAAAEAELVSRALDVTTPPLLNDDATWAAVTDRLDTAGSAHFACHAVTDPDDPLSSALLLQDQPLPVRMVLAGASTRRELAFLSACSTALPGEHLADEALHICSAFQLAGFRHVVGTLWLIGDRIAYEIAEWFYQGLHTGMSPAYALHAVMIRLRANYPDNPLLWAGHVHIGR